MSEVFTLEGDTLHIALPRQLTTVLLVALDEHAQRLVADGGSATAQVAPSVYPDGSEEALFAAATSSLRLDAARGDIQQAADALVTGSAPASDAAKIAAVFNLMRMSAARRLGRLGDPEPDVLDAPRLCDDDVANLGAAVVSELTHTLMGPTPPDPDGI